MCGANLQLFEFTAVLTVQTQYYLYSYDTLQNYSICSVLQYMFCPSISSYLDIDNMYICKICGNLADDQCPTLTDAGAKSLKNMSLLIGDSDTLEFKINDKVHRACL